jgi:hypothetical protein
MILPNQLNVSLWFAAVPIWQREAQTIAPASSEPCVSDPGPECAAPDGAGTTTMCWVFKGYEWRPTALWESFANPAWDQWSQGKHDDSDERALRNDRARSAASRHVPVVPAASEAAPMVDGGTAGTGSIQGGSD